MSLGLGILRNFDISTATLQQSTINITKSRRKRVGPKALKLLGIVYDIREKEERLRRGEIGKTTMEKLLSSESTDLFCRS